MTGHLQTLGEEFMADVTPLSQTEGGGKAAKAAKDWAAGEALGGKSQKVERSGGTPEQVPARDDLDNPAPTGAARVARGPGAGRDNFADRRHSSSESAGREIEPEPPPAQTSSKTRTPAERARRRQQKARRRAARRAEAAAASSSTSRGPVR